MTIKAIRALRNMGLILSTMTISSFFFGMVTFGKANIPNYQIKEFTGEIKTISDIEDLERSKNCNFLFYPTGTNKHSDVKGARLYSKDDVEKVKKVVENAKKEREKCSSGRYVYISL